MKVRGSDKAEEKIELNMTAMIDIVFQLLIFFIMTFKIITPEGDFNIKMPLNAPSSGTPDEIEVPPIKLVLRSDPLGQLSGMTMNDIPMGSFEELNREIRGIVGDGGGPGSMAEQAEVEIDAAYDLHYRFVIDAVTAVSGYVDPNTDQIVKLIEKVKFTAPKER